MNIPPVRKQKSFVYFFERQIDGAIKIGVSTNVENRRRDLEGGAGPIKVLVTMPGSYSLEGQLHGRFNKYRLHGEWFTPHKSLTEYIDTVVSDQRCNTGYYPNGTSKRYLEAGPLKRHRLCLGCMEDWTYSEGPFCPACEIEHDLRRDVRGNWDGKVEPESWWGPEYTSQHRDLDHEDLASGFYVASPYVGEADQPFYDSTHD